MSSLIVSVSRPSAVAVAAGLPTEVVLTRTIVTLAGGGGAGGAVTASAVSIADTGALYAATDVEAALAEVRTVADTAAGGGVTLEQVQDDLGTTSLVAGASLSKVYDDGAGTITLDVDTADFATAAQGALADTATQPGDLGTAATTAATDYATAAQGALADTATQPGDLATVATTGAYADVTGTPTLGTAAAADTGDFAPATFDVRLYGAVLDGTTDDTTSVQAAVTAAAVEGGQVYIPAGECVINGRLDITTAGVSLVGDGPLATDIRLRSAGAGIDIGEFGGACGNFRIHAENTATAPLKFEAGSARKMWPITVESSAGIGVYITDLQNSHFDTLQVFRAAEESLVLDGFVANNLFTNMNLANGQGNFYLMRQTNDIGASSEPYNNRIFASVLETFDPSLNPAGVVHVEAGYLTIEHTELVAATATAPAAQNIVNMSGTAKVVLLDNAKLEGADSVHTGIAASVGEVSLQGKNSFIGFTDVYDLSGTAIVQAYGEPRYLSVGNIGATEATVYSNQLHPMRRVAQSTTELVDQTRISAETQPRFTRNGRGDLKWGDGSAGTDITLYRAAANLMQFFAAKVRSDAIEVVGTGTNNGYLRMTETSSAPFPAGNTITMWTDDDGGGNTRLRARFGTGTIFTIATEGVGLGLGTAAAADTGDFATAAQGATADTALQSVDVPADMTATGTADGTTFLRGDGVWATPPGAGGGISNVVDDVTPQLGGTLDTNGQTITDASDGTVTVDDNLDVVGNITVSGTVDGRDVATDGTKLDGVEAAATADQTGAQIKVAYEAELDTNAFTDAEQSKLAGVETASFTAARSTKLSGIETAADVTDTANVTAAGALMDSEVDANLKTLVLPASTTITAYGATLVDDADAATARTTLELGTAATTAATDYATAAQGATADTATQPGDLGTAAAADTGDFATAAQGTLADTAVQPGTINAQTGTTYTFALSDAGDVVTCDNASAVTATVPPNASVAFPVGSRIEVIGIGAGIVTIAEGAGVTVNATPSLVFRAQHSGCTLIKIATDTWQAVGDFA